MGNQFSGRYRYTFKVRLVIDGSAQPNPGIGGIGVIIQDPTSGYMKEYSLCIGDRFTNNQCELAACVFGLRQLRYPKNTDLEIVTDSQLVIGFGSKGWTPKANHELIAEMRRRLKEIYRISWTKVAGHRPEIDVLHAMHDRADDLARQAVQTRHQALQAMEEARFVR